MKRSPSERVERGFRTFADLFLIIMVGLAVSFLLTPEISKIRLLDRLGSSFAFGCGLVSGAIVARMLTRRHLEGIRGFVNLCQTRLGETAAALKSERERRIRAETLLEELSKKGNGGRRDLPLFSRRILSAGEISRPKTTHEPGIED